MSQSIKPVLSEGPCFWFSSRHEACVGVLDKWACRCPCHPTTDYVNAFGYDPRPRVEWVQYLIKRTLV